MKKLTAVLLAGVATLFFTACGGGGGGNSTPPPEPEPEPIVVNVIGTWDYAVTTQNSICDGLLAQGVEIIESLNGDTTKIGDIIVSGSDFGVDSNQNCFVKPIDVTTSKASGFPSTGTADDWLALGNALNAGDNTIDRIVVDSFNKYKIQTSIYYKNGVVVTSLLTR